MQISINNNSHTKKIKINEIKGGNIKYDKEEYEENSS